MKKARVALKRITNFLLLEEQDETQITHENIDGNVSILRPFNVFSFLKLFFSLFEYLLFIHFCLTLFLRQAEVASQLFYF